MIANSSTSLTLLFLVIISITVEINSFQKINKFTINKFYSHCSKNRLSNLKIASGFTTNEIDLKYKSFQIDSYNKLFLFIPALSAVLPVLYDSIANPTISSSERQFSVLGLLFFKRFYLYLTAYTVLDTTSKIAANNYIPGIGERLLKINEELLPGLINTTMMNTEESKIIYESIDNVNQNSIATGLPFILVFSLIISFGLNTLSSNINLVKDSISNVPFALNIPIQDVVKYLVLSTNVIVCYLFSKNVFTDFANAIFSKSTDSSTITSETTSNNSSSIITIISILLVLLSFIIPPGGLLWPIHNIINVCICIVVGRVFQLNSLISVLLAVIGLMVYDVIAVTGTQTFTDNGQSVMEAIATAKLGLSSSAASSSSISSSVSDAITSSSASISNAVTSTMTTTSNIPTTTTTTTSSSLISSSSSLSSFITPIINTLIHPAWTWRPGIFEVAVNNRISDALGLGDIVFPSILSSWIYRYETTRNRDNNNNNVVNNNKNNNSSNDNDGSLQIISESSNNKDNYSIYRSCMIGYIIGCILNDVFMSGAGQPALLYIVPSMIISMGIQSLLNQEWQNMFQYTSDIPKENDAIN